MSQEPADIERPLTHPPTHPPTGILYHSTFNLQFLPLIHTVVCVMPPNLCTVFYVTQIWWLIFCRSILIMCVIVKLYWPPYINCFRLINHCLLTNLYLLVKFIIYLRSLYISSFSFKYCVLLTFQMRFTG